MSYYLKNFYENINPKNDNGKGEESMRRAFNIIIYGTILVSISGAGMILIKVVWIYSFGLETLDGILIYTVGSSYMGSFNTFGMLIS
jgi:hypothetical protein